jgi:hypothetical protein
MFEIYAGLELFCFCKLTWLLHCLCVGKGRNRLSHFVNGKCSSSMRFIYILLKIFGQLVTNKSTRTVWSWWSLWSHGSLLLLIMMKIMLWHFVGDDHTVMTGLILVMLDFGLAETDRFWNIRVSKNRLLNTCRLYSNIDNAAYPFL